MTSPGSDLAVLGAVQEVKANAENLDLKWGLRAARVDDASGPSPQIILDGDTNPIPGISLIGDVFANSRVWTITIPPSGTYIVGFANTAPLGKTVPYKNLVDTQNATLAAYKDILVGGVAVEVTFTKSHDSSGIEWQFNAGAFASATGVTVQYGLEIDGTDYPTAFLFFNTASQHQSCSATDVITDVSAGVYTVTARWQNPVGTQVNMDGNDLLSFTLKEVAV